MAIYIVEVLFKDGKTTQFECADRGAADIVMEAVRWARNVDTVTISHGAASGYHCHRCESYVRSTDVHYC